VTIGSIISLSQNETDQRKVNFAVQQLLQRNGGQQVNSVATTTSDYTAKVSDFLILVSGNSNVTLPSAATAPGQIYCVKKTDSAATTATIDNNINTIDGSTSASLTSSGQVLMIESDGSQYDAIIKSTAFNFSAVLQTTNALSELSTNAATARTNLGLGTAATQNVGVSANNVVQLSTSAILPAVDGSLLTNLPNQTGRLVAGTPLVLNPYAISTKTTTAHGLGVVPVYVEWIWECLTANLNYSVGDKIIGPFLVNAMALKDATNLTILTLNVLPGFIDKNTLTTATITAADWKLTLTPYKLT